MIAASIVRFCVCSTFCCVSLYGFSSLAIIFMGQKRELVALLCLYSCCVVIIVLLSLTVPWVDLQFVIVVFPDQTRLFFLHQ